MRWLTKNNATFNLSSSTHFQRKSHFHKKQEEELSFRNWATYLRRLCSCKHSNECATLYSFCSNDFSIIRLAKRQDTLFFKSKSLFGTRPFGEPDRKTRSKSHKKFQILERKPSFGEKRSTYYCHFLFIDIHCWPSSSSFSAFFFVEMLGVDVDQRSCYQSFKLHSPFDVFLKDETPFLIFLSRNCCILNKWASQYLASV